MKVLLKLKPRNNSLSLSRLYSQDKKTYYSNQQSKLSNQFESSYPNNNTNNNSNKIQTNNYSNNVLFKNIHDNKSFHTTMTKTNNSILESISPCAKSTQMEDIQITQNPSEKTLTIHSESLGIQNMTLPYMLLRELCQSEDSIDPRTQQKLFKASDIPDEIRPIECVILRDSSDRPYALKITWSHHLKYKHLSDFTSPPNSPTSTFTLKFLENLQLPRSIEIHRHKLGALSPILWALPQSDKSPSSLDHQPYSNWIEKLFKTDQLIFNYDDFFKEENNNLTDNNNNNVEESKKFINNKEILQKKVLEKLNKFGLVIFEGLKNHKNKFHKEEDEYKLSKLINALGLDIRRTFYGDLWDVFSAGNQAKNIANTNLPLDFHMDLVHFENPPRFQFLHCIKNEVSGGISSFVDSYSVAYELLIQDPQAFETLANELIGFEYINNNHHTFFKHPTIKLNNNNNNNFELNQLIEKKKLNHFLNLINSINYSPPFQSPPFHLLSENNQNNLNNQIKFEKVFNSLKKFESFFNDYSSPTDHDHDHDEKNPYKFEILLKPGQVVAFDNRRILHARSGFTSPSAAGTAGGTNTDQSTSNGTYNQVDRWLKGAYVDGDSVWDRIRILNS